VASTDRECGYGPDCNYDLALLDVVGPITLRDSRWRCDHGWDIDLDDGGTNYRIVNNVMLSVGLKFGMEGCDRIARNNIMVNGRLSAHLWPPYTRSVFTHNIVTRSGYIDARVADWGKQIDYNLLPTEAALERSRSLGLDEQSATGMSEQRGANFLDVPENSDAYRDGLRSNDVILAVNRQRVDTAVDLIDLLRETNQSSVTLHVWRQQESTAVGITP